MTARETIMPDTPIPAPASPPKEEVIWMGCPHQAVNFGVWLLCFLIIPIPYAIWVWIKTRSEVYEITTQRIKLHTGILNKKTEDIELYRVKDTTLEEPALLRYYGAGNIIVETHDVSAQHVTLRGIPGARELREKLRESIEAVRDRKRVRTVENE
jgi:uncharacterized membrane protein YdbT with pleckstrin-like domain